jgi:hypothetical protein
MNLPGRGLTMLEKHCSKAIRAMHKDMKLQMDVFPNRVSIFTFFRTTPAITSASKNKIVWQMYARPKYFAPLALLLSLSPALPTKNLIKSSPTVLELRKNRGNIQSG